MNSLILQTATRFLSSLLLVASIFLIWRGHNDPGGGFTGGLMAASAFVLMAISNGPAAAQRALRIPAPTLIGVGLALALIAALIGPLAGGGFFEGRWFTLEILDGSVKLGSPLLFDVGVYLVVVGISLTIMLSLLEEEN